MGSSVFHPESSRVARMASGGRHGLAQSLFQVGGNTGSRDRPAAGGVHRAAARAASVAWFSVAALLGDLRAVAGRPLVRGAMAPRGCSARGAASTRVRPCRRRRVRLALAVLLALIFSKYFYLASLSSYYTFYLIDHFGVSVQSAQLLPLRVPRRRGGGHASSAARSATAFGRKPRDLVLDPGRAAVHAGAAAREPVLDRRSDAWSSA